MVLVQDMMTRDPISVPQDASVDVAIDLMVEKNISGVPVVDEDDLPVGVITEFDVLQYYGKYQDNCPTRYNTCRDTMSADIRTIREDASLEVAAKIFEAVSLRRLLVLSGNRLVGILARRDVVRSIRDGRLSSAAL
jgi:CBS domain-containing protein